MSRTSVTIVLALVVFAGCSNAEGPPDTTPVPAGSSLAPPATETTASPTAQPVCAFDVPAKTPAPVGKGPGGLSPTDRASDVVREVYAAFLDHDYEKLKQLLEGGKAPSDELQQQQELWHRSGARLAVLRVLETQHPEPTDGWTYPGFSFAGGQLIDSTDASDARYLGLSLPAKISCPPSKQAFDVVHGYRGYQVDFEYYDDPPPVHLLWQGIRLAQAN